MTVEVGDLEWALVTAQHRSLRQAAQALNVRQSTLSRRLRDLEDQLGAPLFERTSGGSRPTIAGLEFLEAARHILEETEALTTRFKTRARGESGHLSIGVHASLSAGNLRATLIEHRRRLPEVVLRLVDGSSDHLISDLANASIDVAFVVQGNRRWNGKSLPVWSERVVVALPENHDLTRRDGILWTDLKGEALLLPQRGPGAEFLLLLTNKLGCSDPCRILQHDVSLDRFLSLVGAGWGILLALEGATGAVYPGVVFREVHDERGPTRLEFRAYWRATNSNPSLGPFLEMLRERYPDISSDLRRADEAFGKGNFRGAVEAIPASLAPSERKGGGS